MPSKSSCSAKDRVVTWLSSLQYASPFSLRAHSLPRAGGADRRRSRSDAGVDDRLLSTDRGCRPPGTYNSISLESLGITYASKFSQLTNIPSLDRFLTRSRASSASVSKRPVTLPTPRACPGVRAASIGTNSPPRFLRHSPSAPAAAPSTHFCASSPRTRRGFTPRTR